LGYRAMDSFTLQLNIKKIAKMTDNKKKPLQEQKSIPGQFGEVIPGKIDSIRNQPTVTNTIPAPRPDNNQNKPKSGE
jgi:hypothetical protein